MKNLIILSNILNKIGLTKESSEVLRLKPVEHPDWLQWSQEEEKNLLESSVQELKSIKNLRENDPSSPSLIVEKRLREWGITIIPRDGNSEHIGSGAHGIVYDCVFNGKPAVAKIQFLEKNKPKPYARDVSNWNKIQELIPTFPDWVKKYFPEVFFAKEEDINVVNEFGSVEYNLQVMVMEKLRPLPKELSLSMDSGRTDLTWRWEEAFDKIYSEIDNVMSNAGLVTPIKSFLLRRLVEPRTGAGIKDPSPFSRIARPIFDIIRSSNLEFEEKSFTMEKISDILFAESKKITLPIPRFTSYGYDDIWEPPSGLTEFWDAILWLRKNRVPAGDIIPENIMIDSSGQMKIADLGAMHMSKL